MYVDIKPQYTKENLYFTFSQYVKRKYQSKVGKISIDTDFGCMHNRNKGGCIFCNLEGYRPNNTKTNDIESQWHLGSSKSRYKKFYAYFQLGTPLSSESEKHTLSALENIIHKEDCVGVMFGARSDMTSDYVLKILSNIANKTKKEVWLEMGLQSTNNTTLEYINRGHDYKNFKNIVCKIDEKYKNIYICAHIILGLPKSGYDIESEDDMIRTVKEVSSLPIAAVKYHHLQIVKNTALEKIHDKQNIQTLTEERYIELISKVIGYTNERFIISRLLGDTKNEYLIAPIWNTSKIQILNKINMELKIRNITQGIYL